RPGSHRSGRSAHTPGGRRSATRLPRRRAAPANDTQWRRPYPETGARRLQTGRRRSCNRPTGFIEMENTVISPKFQGAPSIMTGSMKIAVCIKQVMTRETHVRPDQAGTGVREEGASWALSEPDSYALEEALRLRDRLGGAVVALSSGPDRVVQILREALARGADRAVHVAGAHLGGSDAATTAAALALALEAESADLVLTGLQSDDQGSGQVGVILAERLGVD